MIDSGLSMTNKFRYFTFSIIESAYWMQCTQLRASKKNIDIESLNINYLNSNNF